MPVVHPLRFVLYVLAAVVAAGGCSSPDGAASPSDSPEVSGTRTVVEFGPHGSMVAEIVRVGDDARATVQTPAGLVGEEILLGDDHYVRVPDAAVVLGTDRWIHTDLSDPRQRRHLERNPAGFIALAELADLHVGSDVSGREVLSADRSRHDVVRFDLGDGWTIEVTTEVVLSPDPVVAPPPAEVVALVDLPAVASGS